MKGFNIFTGEKVETKNVAEEKAVTERQKFEVTYELPEGLLLDAIKYAEKEEDLKIDIELTREEFGLDGDKTYEVFLAELETLERRLDVIHGLLSDKVSEMWKEIKQRNKGVHFVVGGFFGVEPAEGRIKKAVLENEKEVDLEVWM